MATREPLTSAGILFRQPSFLAELLLSLSVVEWQCGEGNPQVARRGLSIVDNTVTVALAVGTGVVARSRRWWTAALGCVRQPQAGPPTQGYGQITNRKIS